jgi:hypothetical protein
MHLHLTNLQFLIGGFAIIIVAFLALAAYFDFRRKKKPPFLNYLHSDFDRDRFNQDYPRQGSFSEPDEWHTHNHTRMHAYEARDTTTQNRS